MQEFIEAHEVAIRISDSAHIRRQDYVGDGV